MLSLTCSTTKTTTGMTTIQCECLTVRGDLVSFCVLEEQLGSWLDKLKEERGKIVQLFIVGSNHSCR